MVVIESHYAFDILKYLLSVTVKSQHIDTFLRLRHGLTNNSWQATRIDFFILTNACFWSAAPLLFLLQPQKVQF
jgi:hypothetical protein